MYQIVRTEQIIELSFFPAVGECVADGIKYAVRRTTCQIENTGSNHTLQSAAKPEASAYNPAAVFFPQFPVSSFRFGISCDFANLAQQRLDEILPCIERRRGPVCRVTGQEIILRKTVNITG